MTLQKNHHEASLPPLSSYSHSSDNSEQIVSLTNQLRATLSTIIPLLDAFNHRHRNQHRAAPWWSTFGKARRSLKRLSALLECHSSGSTRHFIDNVRTRVAWLKSHILPQAFVAFSQLTADNQHAPLGLFLLALLGQVHDSFTKWLPQHGLLAQPEHISQIPRQGQTCRNPATSDAETIDKGVIISRETIRGIEIHAHKAAPSPTNQCFETSISIVTPTAKDTGEDDEGQVDKKKKKKKKKKRGEDALSSLFGSLD
ncbi:hypothetical protein C2857_001903 [Epichloe festucae Fl1]|uniref:RNase MRP protein 1 RNA binding domain-containing protein n=1 Tax=Epichloe festucae (strain Fl1) TaxID=877507 RepID=A0A7S9PTI7_EPIFF|nr:hypothetical protein C2857_001903 [Epichloe festucae Fl1]